MPVDIKELPDDVASLKQIIVTYQSENTSLKEQVVLLKNALFGRKSEKLSPEEELQGRLFNEAETHSGGEPSRKVTVRGHTRKKRGRKPIPANLPRVDVEHDLNEEEKTCKCGAALIRIKPETTEELEIIPEKVYVNRHIRHKYVCKQCEGTEAEGEKPVKIAPMPPRLIPKSIASAGLIAYILTAKFCDALPFYRLEKIFTRWGVELKRATMCNWAIHVARRCDGLLKLMWKNVIAGSLAGSDETRLQVLREVNRKNTTRSYMWVIRGGPPDSPVILHEYRETHSAGFLIERLSGFKGTLQTDGYGAYEAVAASLKVTHAGCMDHARRKFKDALTVSDGTSRAVRAALRMFRRLYRTEDEARKQGFSPEQILELRQKKSLPRMLWFKRWLDNKSISIPPGSTFGKAVGYTLGEWSKLIVYLHNGEVPISNILVENAIRPFVLGRKNWIFSGSPRGAKASAALYSLVETAKANGLEPYWYLRYLFVKLPLVENDEDLSELLPYNVKPEQIRDFFPAIYPVV